MNTTPRSRNTSSSTPRPPPPRNTFGARPPGIEACKEQRRRSDALFVSVGGNWVGPGSNRQGSDALIRVHREFLATTYELHRLAGLRFAVQARVISERPSASETLRTSLDFGAAAQWARSNFTLTAEADRSAVSFDGGAASAAVSASFKVALPRDLSVAFGVQGRAEDFGAAFKHLAGSVTFSYRDSPVLTQGLGSFGL